MKKKYLMLSLILFILDLFTKFLAEKYLMNQEALVLIPGFFSLTYAENTGAAWSILEGQRLFFVLLSLLVLYYLWQYFKKEREAFNLFALALILAGTLGNFYDRLVYGYVRDMLSFNLFSYPFPIFNLADSCLVVGVFLLLLKMLIDERSLKDDK